MLTPEQQKTYFATQGTSANPLSPAQYEASLNTPTPQPSPAFLTPDQYAGVQQAQAMVAPKPIAIDGLTGDTKPFNLPPAPVEPTPQSYQSIIDASSQSFNDAVKAFLTPPETPLKKEQTSLREKLLGSLGMLGQQTTREEQLKQSTGYNDVTAKLNEISSQVQALNLESKAIPLEIQNEFAGRGATAAGVAPIETGRLRDNAIKTLQLTATGMILQGQQANAQATIDRAIKLEFEPVKAKIDYLQTALGFVREDLSKEDQKRADAFKLVLDERARLLDQAQKEKEQVYSLAQEAIKNGADLATVQKIQAAKTLAEAQQIATPFFAPKPVKADTQVVKLDNGKTVLIDTQTGKVIADLGGAVIPTGTGGTGITPSTPLQAATSKANIDLVSGLIGNSYLNTAVGPNKLARTSFMNIFTGGKDNFIAGVEQLRSQLSLESLIKAKAQGATFGALSDSEMKILSASASKLGTWAIKDKNDPTKIVGYQASEKDFKAELDKINNFAKLDYIIKGGDPQDIGAQIQSDGSIWVLNSDNTYTQLR